ncbi:LacI family DNA-binding transcriptional regulator [Compostimonas suwonensis]|uniref:LacI family transcriptional regulator n=1 Tax=Compostimonas suwonensis TaxID=1048394 RepID=A0A2M9C3W2_9MICO|nr:LacI family DNA-binding transcriptional regulator [Compostimonas suwonensis]PJJ65220.1 LacI family transcriptional regulator [Compostimonas suwonensis]
MVSIADVAAHAGVSPTTVSHTLSGKRKVSPRLRERVEEAMRSLGYAPSRSAQNLALGTTRIVALIVPDIGNGFFADLAKGVEQTAIEHGYNVILCTTGFDHAREVLYLEMIRSRAADGIIYAAGSPPSNSELASLLGDMPLVLVDEDIPGSQAAAVVSDNAAGGRLAAEHLLGLGHSKALVLGANDELVSSGLRVEGFGAAWSDGGGDGPVVTSGGFTEEGGREAILPFIDRLRSGELTAVFAVNDMMALGVVNQLRAHDIAVPGDVSVVGFDDIAAARHSYPALTTVRQDVLTLGATATEILIRGLESSGVLTGSREVLPVALVTRQSSGPLRPDIERAGN